MCSIKNTLLVKSTQGRLVQQIFSRFLDVQTLCIGPTFAHGTFGGSAQETELISKSISLKLYLFAHASSSAYVQRKLTYGKSKNKVLRVT